jgi:hypothetical protein
VKDVRRGMCSGYEEGFTKDVRRGVCEGCEERYLCAEGVKRDV